MKDLTVLYWSEVCCRWAQQAAPLRWFAQYGWVSPAASRFRRHLRTRPCNTSLTITKYLPVLSFALALLVSPLVFSADVELALEAELADKIEAPMIIAEDELASNGKFIWMEGAPATGGGGQGWAEYIIDIPEAGKYALWGYVIAWDGNSDSFWVTWQPADPDEDPQQTQNTEFRWGVAQGAAWHWDRINHWLDGGTFDREWEFDQVGKTTLRVGVREDATMLDAIFVTSNVKATNEGDANVRLPDDDDRELQKEGQAVNPKDKVATTWAKVKSQYR